MATLNQIEMNKMREIERHNREQEDLEATRNLTKFATDAASAVLNPYGRIASASMKALSNAGSSAIIPWNLSKTMKFK